MSGLDRTTVILERRSRIGDPLLPAAILATSVHLALAAFVVGSHWIARHPPQISRAIPIRIIAGGGARELPPPPPVPSETPPVLATPPAVAPKTPRQKIEPAAPKQDPRKLADPISVSKPKPPAPQPAAHPALPEKPPAAATRTPAVPAAALVVSPGGGPGVGFASEGPAIDEEDFQFPVYIQQMLQSISRNWYRPQVGDTSGCTVYFKIGRAGQLLDWRMEIGSGLSHFDRSAIRAVQNAGPYPPLPIDFSGPSLGIHLKFQ